MLLIYGDEALLDEAKRQACYQESALLTQSLRDAGQYLASSPLRPTATATSVRLRDGQRVITDGPFAETREQLGGYYLIEAANLDEALHVAARVPAAHWGTVEVRPVLEITGLTTASQLTKGTEHVC